MAVSGRFVSALAVVVAMLALAAPAKADDVRLEVRWDKVLSQGWHLAMEGVVPEHESSAAIGTESAHPGPSEFGNAFFGAAPHVSLVARDWGEARRLAGRLSVTDQFRLSRSSRMVVARVRLGEGMLAPFGQLGLGQWRVDTDLMPGWARDTEVAAQFGGGIELRITHAYAFAVETDYTVLYRETHEPQNIPYPRFWGTLAASRVEF